MKRLLHYLPFVHFYKRWETIIDGEMQNNNTKGIVGITFVQQRMCSVCNKMQIRVVTKAY